MLLASDGFPARTPLVRTSTRQRKPARPRSDDPRKTVKPTPRGKYGLGPRKERPLQLDEARPASRSSSSSSGSEAHVQFYQQLVAGTWPGLPSNQLRQRPRLFAAASGADAATATGAAGVCRKLQPVLRTTQRWTRLQRKVLPKYLLALDDQTSLLLLKCLTRLQPPLVPPTAATQGQQQAAISGSSPALVSEQLNQGSAANGRQQQQQWVQLTAAAIPTSINGALRHRHLAAQGYPALSTAAEDIAAAAADAAAAARGFVSAADERAQFELMLAGVAAVLQQKLPTWRDGRRMVEALCWLAQLHTYQEGLLQAWFAATELHLQHLPASYLATCSEALASLGATVPSQWLQAYSAATQGRLKELSLQQLATLLMHVADLQLQLPDSWWQEYQHRVLRRVAAKLVVFDKQGVQLAPAGASSQEQQGEQQQQQQVLLEARVSRIRAAADAVCGMLWACSQLPGQPLQQQWLERCLELLLPAVAAQQCAPGAAVQLLHACCAGACRKLPAAGSTMQACLVCMQQRLPKVCADVNTLQLLLACMQVRSVQKQLPQGFCADLEAVLVPLLPSLPTELLVRVAAVLGSVQHSPGLEFLSAFALVTQQRLGSMRPQELLVLVDSCVRMRAVMPSLWVAAVLQQLQHCLADTHGVVISAGAAADATLDGLNAADVHDALQQLERVAADWPAACAGSAGAADYLQGVVQ